MTKKQIRQCLKPFFLNTGTNISDYLIDIGEQEYVEAERATIVRFTCDGVSGNFASAEIGSFSFGRNRQD